MFSWKTRLSFQIWDRYRMHSNPFKIFIRYKRWDLSKFSWFQSFQVFETLKSTHKCLDGVHFRCGKLLLRHPWTDLDETFRMYRVDLEIMHREIFDFRFRPQTGSWLFFANRKLKRSEPEVETYLIGKLASFCNESPIFVFWTFNPGNRYNHFCPGISIYYYIGDKIFQKPLAPPLFKISKK